MKLKRLLAFLLAFVMMFSLTTPAYAEGGGDDEYTEEAGEISKVNEDEEILEEAEPAIAPAEEVTGVTLDPGPVRGRNDVATVAYADGEGFEGYTSLEDAIAAAGTEIGGYPLGNTVQLARDVELSTSLEIQKTIVLDLNGKTLTASNATIKNQGDLTIKDSAGEGLIKSTGSQGVLAMSGSKTTVESGAITGQEGAIFPAGGATVTINGGTFTGIDNAVLITNGSAGKGGNTITVNGGTFIGTIQTAGYIACGIYAANDDTWNINGGTFAITGGAGIVARAGKINIGDDVVITTTGNATGKVGDSRVVVPCAAIVFDAEAQYPGLNENSKLEVTGGEFTSAVAPVQAIGENYIAISGGKFSAAPADKYFVDGLTASSAPGEDGFFTVVDDTRQARIGDVRYETLEAAVAAAQDGETITLLKDIAIDTGNNRFPIKRSITIDGNYHTISINNRGFGVGMNAESNIDVTFKNVTIENNTEGGRCIDTRGNLNSLTLDGVTLKAAAEKTQPLTIGGNQVDPATVTIRNSKIQTMDDGSYGYAITTFNPVNMTITDSTVKGWACLNIKGASSSAGSAGSTFTITDSSLVSKNVYPGETNGFGAIKIEDKNVTVNITGTAIAIVGEKNSQAIVSFDEDNTLTGTTVNMGEGNTVTMTGETGFAYNNSDTAVLSISGGTFNMPVPEEVCAEGYIPKDNGDGTYTVKSGHYVAQVGEAKFESFAEAAEAANGGTITLLADAGSFTLAVDQTLMVQLNGHALTINAQEGYFVNEVVEEGVTTYTAALIVAKIGETPYATVADALAAAQNGDVVEVFAGEHEIPATVVIPENVTLKGEGKDQTTLKITTTNGDGLKITNQTVTISDMTIDGSNITNGGYNSVINVEADGCIIDNVVVSGGGKSTWNSSILVERLTATQTFTVKNSTISGSFRGVLRESCSANIVIENCEIDAIYPFNIDGGSGGEITVTGSKLHGWSSYSGVDKVTFTNCEFSKGNSGYDVVAAYVDTYFEGCTFDADFDVYAQTNPFDFNFDNCKKDGTDLTFVNFTENFTDSDVWIKCDTYVNGHLVGAVAKIGEGGKGNEFKTVQAAVDAAHELDGEVTVTLLADVTEVVVIHQKAGLNLTVDGDGKTVTGQFYIDGDGRYNDIDTLTIQNVKFAYDAATYDDAFIDVPSTKTAGKPYSTGKYNYAHNLTITGCEFAGEGTTTVAVRVASGAGAHGLVLQDLTVTGGHSFAQLVGVKDLTVTGCTATGVKNGINISGGEGQAVISNTAITSDATEGYTVRLKDASAMAVTLTGNTFSGGEGIISTATGGTITIVDGKYAGPLPTDKTKFTVKGGVFTVAPAIDVCEEGLYPIANTDPETMTYYPYTVGDAVAVVNNIGYATFAEAAAARTSDDDVITLLAKITDKYTIAVGETLKVNKNGKTFSNSNVIVEGPYLVVSTVSDGITTYTVEEAAVEYTAANGTVSYKKNLDYSNVSGSGTYKLLKDITAESRIVPGIMASDVTIDLNGHTLTSTATDYTFYLSRNGSAASHKTFAIVDTSDTKGGKVIVNPDADAALQVSGKYNDITIGEGVTIEGGCVAMLSENQTLDVSGTINGGDDFAVATNGSFSKNVTITVHDGAVLTSNETAMYLPGNEGLKANIEGGTITGKTGIEVRAGELNVTGGTITANGTFTEEANGSGTTITGAAVAISQHTTNLPITVTISGGTLTGEKALYEVDLQDETTENVTVEVTGGYFTGEVESKNLKGFITQGHFSEEPEASYIIPGKCAVKEDEWWIVGDAVAAIGDVGYASLEAAVAAANDGDTVKLLKDVEETVTVSKSITLDLNEKKLTGRLTIDNGTVEVKNGTIEGRVDGYDNANLTIAADAAINGQLIVWGDGEKGQEGCKTPTVTVLGTITNSGDAAISTNGTDKSGAKIIIGESAKISSDDIAIYLPSGNLTVNGGEITGATAIYQKSGSLEVNGGTITGNGAKADYNFNGNGANATGDAIVVESCGYPNGDPVVEITGGTFTSDNAKGIGAYYDKTNKNELALVTSTDNTITVRDDQMWIETETAGVYKLVEAVVVTFVTEDGIVAPEAQKIEKGTKATKPTDPTKEHYSFLGWFAEGAETPFDFTTAITENITLTAKFEGDPIMIIYTDSVTGGVLQQFNVHYGDGKEAYTFTNFDSIQAREGYHYDMTNMWTIPVADTATEDTVYVLKWIKGLAVTFNADNGTDPVAVDVNEGETVAKPADPTKEGYTFAGWFNGNNEYDFSKPVTESLVLTAHWTANKMTVIFKVDDETTEVLVDYGTAVAEPAAPTKDGCIFAGWFAEGAETAFDFTTAITADITLTAHWNEAVAKIGEIGYTSLEDAFAAAQNGDTITLLKDVTINSITVDKTVTLDLDGKEVSSASPELFVVTGDLTITGDGKITGPANGEKFDSQSLIRVDGGKLTVENGTLTATGAGSDGMYGVYVLNGGTAVFGTEDGNGPMITSHFAAIGTNNTTAPATITVNGGTYTANAAPAASDWWSYFCAPIYAASAGTYTINGGTFNGYYGLSDRYVNVDQTVTIGSAAQFEASSGTQIFVDEKTGSAGIENRTIKAANDALRVPEGYAWLMLPEEEYLLVKEVKVTFDLAGGTILVEGDDNGQKIVKTVPAGGTVEAPADPVKKGFTFAGWFYEDAEFDFDTPITEDITLTAHWNEITYVAENTTTGKKYETLNAALSEAESGQKVVPLTNITDEAYILVMNGVTLDLQGYNVTGAKLFYVTGTLIDSKVTTNDRGHFSADAYYLGKSQGSYFPIFDSQTRTYSLYRVSVRQYDKDSEDWYNFRLLNQSDRPYAINRILSDSNMGLVTAAVMMSWTEGSGESAKTVQKTITLSKDLMTKVFNDPYNKTFKVKFTGLDGFTGVQAVPCFLVYDANGAIMMTLEGTSWNLN